MTSHELMSPFKPLAESAGSVQPIVIPDICGAAMNPLFRELPPMISRALYIIVEDQRIKDSDPLQLLPSQLFKHSQSRMSNAKLLTRESACLQGVPSQAVDRFLELVTF
jgi:hypothetical protein